MQQCHPNVLTLVFHHSLANIYDLIKAPFTSRGVSVHVSANVRKTHPNVWVAVTHLGIKNVHCKTHLAKLEFYAGEMALSGYMHIKGYLSKKYFK